MRVRRRDATSHGVKLHLIGRGYTGVTGDQIEGFEMYRHDLRSQLGLEVSRGDLFNLRDIEHEVRNCTADVVMVMTGFTEDAAELTAMFQRLYERSRRPKLVYLDYFAQTSSPYFGILPYVDRYVKRQILRDRSRYHEVFRGGYVFTDWYTQQYGYDLNGWNFGSPIDPKYMDRLVVGWSLGVRATYRRTLAAHRWVGKRVGRRKYDVNARLGLQKRPQREWYEDYRERSQAAVERLRARYSLTPTARIDRWKYMLELNDSKIIFSPFGWGELCYRDYEAVCWGAVLMKPSMSHVEVYPNIFTEGETYVPLAWDAADLESQVEACVSNPKQAERLAKAAQTALHSYFERGGFIRDVRRSLDGL